MSHVIIVSLLFYLGFVIGHNMKRGEMSCTGLYGFTPLGPALRQGAVYILFNVLADTHVVVLL